MCANNPALEISAYVRRIHPCAEMIQITSSLARIYAQTPILYSMIFLRCTQIIQKSKLFNAHICKNSTTGWFAPCAKTPNWINTYIRLDFDNIMLFNCLGYIFNIYGDFEILCNSIANL